MSTTLTWQFGNFEFLNWQICQFKNLFLSLPHNLKSGDNTINTAIKIMIQARFVDDSTIEVIAQDGEKFTWNTYFPTPKQNQQYFAGRFAYYFQKYSEDNINMGLGYWIWIKMNYDEGLGIYGGKGDREEERIFLFQERVRIGQKIRELRKEKNIEAKMLAQIANIDAANLSRIEQGKYSVGIDILAKLAFALGCHIEILPNQM